MALVALVVAALAFASTGCGGRDAGRDVAAPVTVSKPPPVRDTRKRNCFERPSACGFPDATNSGVPRGTVLTPAATAELPSGTTWDPGAKQLTISAAGTVISGLDVRGGVIIRAPRVTIRASRIITGADGVAIAIPNDSPGTDTKIVDVEAGGARGGPGATAAISNRGSNDLTITGSAFHDCFECFQNQARSGGTTTISDTSMRTSDPVAGCGEECPHYEAVYVSGNPGPMTFDHNTMLNPVNQTAVLFVDEDRHDDLTLTDNLLAGGGYVVVGGAQSRRQVIRGNRFSNAFQTKGLDTHSGGPWPLGEVCKRERSSGCFGNVTAVPPPAELTWSANVWDDTLGPVEF